MKLHIVLVEPEIPANTGNISRTCSVADMPLHLVHPLGFDISEKQVRRAGLDYWDELDLNEYQSFDEVMQRYPDGVFFFSNRDHAGCRTDSTLHAIAGRTGTGTYITFFEFFRC